MSEWWEEKSTAVKEPNITSGAWWEDQSEVVNSSQPETGEDYIEKREDVIRMSQESGLPVGTTNKHYESLKRIEEKKPIGFVEGLKQDPLYKTPFVGAVVEGTDLLRVRDAAIRLNDEDYDWEHAAGTETLKERRKRSLKTWTAESLKKRDEDVVTDYITKMAERQERGYTTGGKIGMGLSILPAWMIEFALTGGLYQAGNKATKKLISKHIKNRMVNLTAGWLAGSAARTTVGMPHRIFAETMRQSLTQDEGWATSIAKGWGSVFIEASSEEAGRGLVWLGGGLAKKLPFGGKFISEMQKAWLKLSPDNTAAQFAKRITTKAGYDGLIGEFGEERLASLMHAVVGTETFGLPKGSSIPERLAAAAKQDFDKSNLLAEAVVLSVPGGVRVGVAQAGQFMDNKALSKSMQEIGASKEAADKAVKIKNTEGAQAADAYLSDVLSEGKEIADANLQKEKTEEAPKVEAPKVSRTEQAQAELKEALKPIPAIREGATQADIESVEREVSQRTEKIEKATKKVQEAKAAEIKEKADELKEARDKLAETEEVNTEINKQRKIIDEANQLLEEINRPIKARVEGAKQAEPDVVRAELTERQKMADEVSAVLNKAQESLDAAEKRAEELKEPTEPYKQTRKAIKGVLDALGEYSKMINPFVFREEEASKALKKAVPQKPKPVLTRATYPRYSDGAGQSIFYMEFDATEKIPTTEELKNWLNDNSFGARVEVVGGGVGFGEAVKGNRQFRVDVMNKHGAHSRDAAKQLYDEKLGVPEDFHEKTAIERAYPFEHRFRTVGKKVAEAAAGVTSTQTTEPAAATKEDVPKGIETSQRSKVPRKESGFVNVGKVADVAKAPVKMIVDLLEPAKPAARKFGREPVSDVMRGTFGKAEAKVLDYNKQQLESIDKTYSQMEDYLNQFPEDVQEAIMLTRGHNLEGAARKLQVEAFKKLPPELSDAKIRRALDEIADFNYEYLSEVFGEEVETLWGVEKIVPAGYVRDYHYGVYKNHKKIDQFLEFWPSTDRYLKHKVHPTYADAKAFGLEARYKNPVTNLKAQYRAIAKRESMMWLRDRLEAYGDSIVMDVADAPIEWETIGGGGRVEPTFEGVRVAPEMAKVINSLLAANKITGNPKLDTIRQINNFIRSVKFIGSTFHMMQIAKQSVFDQPYMGLHKLAGKEGWRGFTRGFTKDDPVFKTPEYRFYVENGGNHHTSVESEARKVFVDTMKKLTEAEQAILKTAATPIRIPVGFVDWMFNSYIPKVKYMKYLDRVAEFERKTGTPITGKDSQEIIKEIQNFYGMMNEKLFGRSGTVTSAMRFVWMAPSYAEGNFRTMVKSIGQWGQGEDGFSAARSRANIINSVVGITVAATIGTRLMTGKWPEPPETIEELRDLMKIDTGKKDEHGRKVMLNLATYEKDYTDTLLPILRGRPDEAIESAIKRTGGMKSLFIQLTGDSIKLLTGSAIYDWKDDKVYHPSDPLIQKYVKLAKYEMEQLQPISVSVYKTARQRGVDKGIAALEAVLGLRPARTERDRQEFEIKKQLWDMQEKREKHGAKFNSYDNPWRAIEIFNRTLDDMLDNKFVTEELIEDINAKRIDPEEVITWKRFPPKHMTVSQIVKALEANTHKSFYRAADKSIKRKGDPHKGYENTVKNLKAEFKKRTGKDYRRGMKK